MDGLKLPTAKTEASTSARLSDFIWDILQQTTSVSQNIRGMLAENANRISKLMFKWSVELNMMMHIVAAHFKDDVSDLRALRGYSADEVKRTYGNISFDTALDIQRGNSGD